MRKRKQASKATDSHGLLEAALKFAEPRPTPGSSQTDKIQYAVRFSERIAALIAEDLKPKFPGIDATTKRNAGSISGRKQLDINFSTPAWGLALGVSLKSVHIREQKGRYTHNKKRNGEELRIEAHAYHKRQPYAVMIGVLFLPSDSCSDAKRAIDPSSFGSWAKFLRPMTGRKEPDEDPLLFEKIYIALYDVSSLDLAFFDVESAPPKHGAPASDGPLYGSDGRPRRLLSYTEFLDEVYRLYQDRNPTEFRWADGEVEILFPGEDES